MREDQLQQILDSIDKQLKAGIETHVNGKIRALTAKMDEYIHEENDRYERNEEWKKRVTPAIETMEHLSTFGTIGMGLLKFIVVVGAASAAIIAFISYWRK